MKVFLVYTIETKCEISEIAYISSKKQIYNPPGLMQKWYDMSVMESDYQISPTRARQTLV